jgi:hypothetical protein
VAASNSNRLLLVGTLVFVVGVALVLLVFWGLNNDDEPTEVVTEQPTGQVQDPVAQPTGPLALLPLPLEVPSEMEGVAIELSRIRGLVSTPIPGDLVAIYQLQDSSTFLLEDPADPVSEPVLPDSATLLVSDIEVLGNAGGENPTFIISLSPADVPQLLPLIEAKQLWFTLLPQPEEVTTESAA